MEWEKEIDNVDQMIANQDGSNPNNLEALTDRRAALVRTYLANFFERSLEYLNYFPRSNLTNILQHIDC